MRPLPRSLRRRLRRIDWLHEFVRAIRARKQERQYIDLRERYYRQAGPVFAAPGWRLRSLELLRRRWSGPVQIKTCLKDVRVFAIAADDLSGPRILRALSECCELELFDLRQYRVLDDQETGERAAANVRQWRPRLQRDAVAAFKAAHDRRPIDVVFAYVSYFDCDPHTLRTISACGVPVVNLWLDDKHTFLPKRLPWPTGQTPLVGSVDVNLTNSFDVVRWYLGEGVPAYFMPQGVDPKIFRPMDVDKTVDVCFIGQRYGMRGRLIDALRAAGVSVACFGAGWGTRRITDEEKVEMCSRARINLGIGGTGVSERVMCVKGRDFEVPACGALYLTTYNPELAFLYDIGKEILCYLNEIDCAEIVRYYLERPEEAQNIAAAGRARCLRDHTWAARFQEVLEWMGIVTPLAAKDTKPVTYAVDNEV